MLSNDILKIKAQNLAKTYLKYDCDNTEECDINYLDALNNACDGLSTEDIFKLQHMAQLYKNYYSEVIPLNKKYNLLEKELSEIKSKREELKTEYAKQMKQAEKGFVIYEQQKV